MVKLKNRYKERINLNYFCPICGVCDVSEKHKQTVVTIEKCFLFNCGYCKNKTVIII